MPLQWVVAVTTETLPGMPTPLTVLVFVVPPPEEEPPEDPPPQAASHGNPIAKTQTISNLFMVTPSENVKATLTVPCSSLGLFQRSIRADLDLHQQGPDMGLFKPPRKAHA